MTKLFSSSLIIIHLSTLLFSFNIYCQKENNNSLHDQVGFSISPDYTNQYHGVGQMGISTCINYTTRTKSNRSRWDIGILYSYSRNKTEKLYSSYYPTLSDTFSIGYSTVQFIDFPIKLNIFLIENDKILIYFVGGVSIGTILKNQRQYFYYDSQSSNFLYKNPKKEISWDQNTTLAFHAGIGTEYKFKKDTSLTFQLETRLKSTLDIVGGHTYSSIGLNIGIRQYFGTRVYY